MTIMRKWFKSENIIKKNAKKKKKKDIVRLKTGK